MKNYYAILEVPVGSDVGEIREAYRRLVQEHLWNKDTFAELKEAYEVLTTPLRRAEYDRATFGHTVAIYPAPDQGAGEARTAVLHMPRQCPVNAAAQCPVVGGRVPPSDVFCPECGFLLASMPPEGFELPAAIDLEQQIRLEDPTGRLHRLHPGINSVGREGADVLLADKTVSRHHAKMEVGDDGTVQVEDLGSTNGTQVNGDVLAPHAARVLANDDLVRFGSVSLRLRVPTPAPAAAVASERTAMMPPPGSEDAAASTPGIRAKLVGTRGVTVREYLLVPGVTTFGRRPENSIIIRDDAYVSGNHAQIIADEAGFRLTDVGSTNGTFLNGKRLEPNDPLALAAGDEIIIGGTTYQFEPLDPPSSAPEEPKEAPALGGEDEPEPPGTAPVAGLSDGEAAAAAESGEEAEAGGAAADEADTIQPDTADAPDNRSHWRLRR